MNSRRIAEFVDYHMNGDGECNNAVLKAWADGNSLSLQERYELAYFFSVTYCVQSAIILFEEQRNIYLDIKSWVERNMAKIVFQSDRKYIKMGDRFEVVLEQFECISSADNFLRSVCDDGVLSLEKAIPQVCTWAMFGRFSAFLFLETLAELTGIEVTNSKICWADGDTATSGLMNIFGYDDQANYFDKTGKLLLPVGLLDGMLAEVENAVKAAGGDTNTTKLETSLCAYRKFHKGTRYNGYYLDRMLEEIKKMSAEYPELSNELIEIRKSLFPAKYLGEVGGWQGVRRKLKKMYLQTGVIG